ncbi:MULTISPECIES: hypothetical protein [unclassified Psychrobacter]|uniref:hypothetical protein n=1 Tax=unclassified Psychrobacter TaxID=196806 RepID=UPI003FD15415
MKKLLKPMRYGLLFVLAISLTLSACQKEPEPETPIEVETQSMPATADMTTKQPTQNVEEPEVDEREINLDALDDIDELDQEADLQDVAPNPEQAVKGTQITDVKYRSDAGDTLSVIFETSASGVLNAIVTLPNRPKMTLSAPEGQGNNPTYRSNDGSVELISHGGGSSIDVIQNGKVTNYNATSAEAEVVTE